MTSAEAELKSIKSSAEEAKQELHTRMIVLETRLRAWEGATPVIMNQGSACTLQRRAPNGTSSWRTAKGAPVQMHVYLLLGLLWMGLMTCNTSVYGWSK